MQCGHLMVPMYPLFVVEKICSIPRNILGKDKAPNVTEILFIFIVSSNNLLSDKVSIINSNKNSPKAKENNPAQNLKYFHTFPI